MREGLHQLAPTLTLCALTTEDNLTGVLKWSIGHRKFHGFHMKSSTTYYPLRYFGRSEHV